VEISEVEREPLEKVFPRPERTMGALRRGGLDYTPGFFLLKKTWPWHCNKKLKAGTPGRGERITLFYNDQVMPGGIIEQQSVFQGKVEIKNSGGGGFPSAAIQQLGGVLSIS